MSDIVSLGCDEALDEALTRMGLKRFEMPKPKLNGNVSLFEVVRDRCLATLADMADEYASEGGIAFGFADHREFNAFAQRTSRDMICLYVPGDPDLMGLLSWAHGPARALCLDRRYRPVRRRAAAVEG